MTNDYNLLFDSGCLFKDTDNIAPFGALKKRIKKLPVKHILGQPINKSHEHRKHPA